MYPFIRVFAHVLVARRMPRLGLTGLHVSRHRCWPQDIDFWRELNNGRALTLYDMGRLALSERTGMPAVMAANGWGLTVAGSTIRYRRRVRVLNRIEMRSRVAGWDRRFLYFTQSMWVRGECANSALVRMAVTSADGIVPPEKIAEAMGADPSSPPLPAWIAAWSDADAKRPWPPVD